MAVRGGLNRPLKVCWIMVSGLTRIEILCREMCRCVHLTRDIMCCFPNCDGGIVKFRGKEEKQQKHESTRNFTLKTRETVMLNVSKNTCC